MKNSKSIYLIQFKTGTNIPAIKVGISDDCYARYRTYTHPWCRKILRAEFLVVDHPRRIESKVIKKYKDNIEHNSNEFITNVEFEVLKAFIWNNRMTRPEGMFVFDNRVKNADWVSLLKEIVYKL